MKAQSNFDHSKNRFRNVLAFSLVEMLVVAFIIAVLVALLFPVAQSLIAKAAAVTCASHMRQVGAALMAYRGDHDGWFPLGYPMTQQAIVATNQQPGMPNQPGQGGLKFGDILVPDYLDELPVCPLVKMVPAKRKAFPSAKKFMQDHGGTYAINALLLQTKIESLPPQWWPFSVKKDYSPARMTFLAEVGSISVTWAFTHVDQALEGIGGYGTMGRNHGRGDMLNFMFLDNHMELISRNDPRDVPESSKSWTFPTNPNGRFEGYGRYGLFISPYSMTGAQFEATYPQFFPPPGP